MLKNNKWTGEEIEKKRDEKKKSQKNKEAFAQDEKQDIMVSKGSCRTKRCQLPSMQLFARVRRCTLKCWHVDDAVCEGETRRHAKHLSGSCLRRRRELPFFFGSQLPSFPHLHARDACAMSLVAVRSDTLCAGSPRCRFMTG